MIKNIYIIFIFILVIKLYNVYNAEYKTYLNQHKKYHNIFGFKDMVVKLQHIQYCRWRIKKRMDIGFKIDAVEKIKQE